MDQELTPDQTEKLVQFQELSGIDDLSRCKEVLERHLWDVETAIHDHLGLDPREQVPESPEVERIQRAFPPPSRVLRPTHSDSVIQRVLSFFFNPFAGDQIGLWPLSNRRPEGFTGWLLFFSTLPLRIAVITFYQISHYVIGIIRPGPRQVTDPSQNVMSFIQDYDQTYGANHPSFYVGTYNQVLNEAKKDLKFLLVYLHSKDHQDTNKFCQQTLSQPEVVQFINDNCLMWGCSVDTFEGYRVSQSLRENTYPFIAVVVQREYRMTVVGRIEGFVGPQEFLERLRGIITDNEAFLVVARADREERSFTQALRQEQDQAYLESLRADQEKEEKKRRKKLLEEERIREVQEQLEAEQKKKDELIQRKIDAVNFVPDEPSPDESGLCRILVRLPKGQKLERRFHRTINTLRDLYYFILAHPDSPYEFEMATSFPKRTLPWQPGLESYPTLAEVGLGASEALLVLDLDA
nr:EOG090X0B12 [Polyphemus pediculus]